MKHEELMKGLKALLAVIELHKPIMAFGDHVIICAECEKGAGNGLDYPCPTIQAIEAELK
jgi:hypothetical protein